jgi:hypothetical protein
MKNNTFDVDTMSFIFDDTAIQNPTLSPCARFTVSPKDYGFSIDGTGGGCTAWVKRLENGVLVLTNGNLGHELGEVGKGFDMCFYDGSDDDDTDTWGNRIACMDLNVGIFPADHTTEEGSVVCYTEVTKIINKVYDKLDIFIDKNQALALVDIFKKIDLANT